MVRDFKDTYKGTCLVIGNGPSLENTPLEELMEKYPSFGANKIYGRALRNPTFWTCVDMDMLHDCLPWVLTNWKLKIDQPHLFIPRTVPVRGVHGLNVVIEPGFSKDAAAKVILGGTVTYVNLQLAYYMGFDTVLLVGVDHRYNKSSQGGLPGTKMVAEGDDPDHFVMNDGSPYFRPGKIYNRPELDAVAKYTYPTARSHYEEAGRRIINLTPNTALDAFEKQDVSKWLPKGVSTSSR